jgi:hypothetical protein
MARLTYHARKNLPDSAFALPAKRKLPLTNARGRLDPHHIGNAAARLSMMRRRKTISHGDYVKAHRAITRAERETGMGKAMENPGGGFVEEHPWMTFFLGLAAINTVGWLAVVAVAASQKPAGVVAPTYSQASVIPIPEGTAPTVKVGDSLIIVRSGAAVDATTSNSAVLAPASGVSGGFVAVAPGTAVVTSAATGAQSTVTVVLTGTAGVGKPAVKKPPFPFLPKVLRIGA